MKTKRKKMETVHVITDLIRNMITDIKQTKTQVTKTQQHTFPNTDIVMCLNRVSKTNKLWLKIKF